MECYHVDVPTDFCNVCETKFITQTGISPLFTSKLTHTCECNLSLERMHQRIYHLSKSSIVKMKKDEVVKGLEKLVIPPKGTADSPCKPCLQGKQTRRAFNYSQNKDPQHKGEWKPGEKAHADLLVFNKRSLKGYKYWFHIMDEATRYVVGWPLRHKSEAPNKVKEYEVMVRQQFPDVSRPLEISAVKELRIDGESSLNSNDFKSHCVRVGLDPHPTPGYTPQHNAKSERVGKTIAEAVIELN